MPRFVVRRWHGYHMVFAMCFCLVLVALLSTYRWMYGVVGLMIFFVLFLLLYQAERTFRKDFTEYVSTLNYRIKNAGQTALEHLPVGVLLYNREGQVEWHNSFVLQMCRRERIIGCPVEEIFPGLRKGKDKFVGSDSLCLGEKSFEVIHQPEERLYFFRDISRLEQLRQKYREEKTVLGFIQLDNYDEANQALDQESTQLISDILTAISKWALEYNLTLKRLEPDKIFFVTQQGALQKVIKSKFDILDTIRELTKRYKVPITLSIGVSNVGDTMIERSQQAHTSLEIALARGGDQVAVQDEKQLLFFGGKTNALEKRTRVRARTISDMMRKLIRQNKRVLVMGHKHLDMDAIGAAIGVVRFSLINDREAYIVLDEENVSIERIRKEIEKDDYLGDHLITPEKALSWADDSETLVILVDTHKPSLAIEPRILERAKHVVVIDHHRRGEDFVKEAVLVYLEPYASSTCELVTELLEYQESRLRMEPLEATALLAGIVVDTQNFTFRSGSRTFEAASFLKRHGADSVMVQTLLKEDLVQYVKRAEIVKNTELFYEEVAVAIGDEHETYDQLSIAQAANTLLNMHGVTASFVIAKREDGMVSISARSLGGINVQLIMERLGGGGHLTNAASQLKGVSLKETKTRVVEIIKEILEGGK